MADVTVRTADALYAAVKAASPGDRVLLATGDYGRVALSGLKAAPGVTVSPEPGAAAVFNNIEVGGAAGLHFSGPIEVWTRDPTQHNASYGVCVNGSADVSFTGLKIHGPAKGDPGPASGVGVFARGCHGPITIEACEFFDLGVGVSAMDCAGVTVRKNSFHDLQTDGADFSGCAAPVVADNTFADFYPAPGAHPDAIQFWGTPANPQGKDATVAGNLIRRGAGRPMQGVFAENQANLTISGNAMSGTMFNGVSVSRVAGALIEGNFVQGAADMGSRIIARGGSSDVTVRDNTVSEPVANLRQAGEAPTVRFVLGDNATVATAAVGPDGGPDRTQLDAWLAEQGGAPAPADGRDAQIAALTLRATEAEAELGAEQAKVTEVLTKLSDASRALAADEARIAAAQTALGG